MPPKERDLFALEWVVCRGLNWNQTGLLFPGSKLKKPDLNSLLHDFSEEIRARVNIVEESHAENCRQVRALDSKFRSLNTAAAGLLNNGTEAIKGYGRLASALNVQQQAILRKSEPFVKPNASKGGSKPWDKPAPLSTVMSGSLASTTWPRTHGSSGSGQETGRRANNQPEQSGEILFCLSIYGYICMSVSLPL